VKYMGFGSTFMPRKRGRNCISFIASAAYIFHSLAVCILNNTISQAVWPLHQPQKK